jgi:hypothetical protein
MRRKWEAGAQKMRSKCAGNGKQVRSYFGSVYW